MINMKSIIRSIKQTDFTTIITTKSGIVKVYKFDTIEENNEYYYSITNNSQYKKVINSHLES